jgi:UDP-N-acetylglucosamine pyrophosphorylase
MSDARLETIISEKMRIAGVGEPTINAFLDARRRVCAGERGMVPESEIQPIDQLPRLEELPDNAEDGTALLRQLAVFKLNGGLGTGMGLDRTKSLLPVRDGETFLDFIARQILHLRGQTGETTPRFVLMNSFTTRDETLAFLTKYPALMSAGPVDFLQSKVPKLWVDTWEPALWPADPDLEWCPPGHGDFYPSLLNSGMLEALLAQGVRYGFVSNSDNLGATVDLSLLRYFAGSGFSFLMEVAERTAADRKGGHLARRVSSGRLLLRESAQCRMEDDAVFQDIARHRFFNTNNLWVRLDHLATALQEQGGAMRLPLITNTKTVDPKDPASPKVVQLESAMGAAIEAFERTGAVVVPRARFSPVKSTSDLVALRSDAYETTPDHRLVLAPARHGVPPTVDLDARHYRLLAGFEALFPGAAPSLIRCDTLKVEGPIRFEGGVVCEGAVTFRNTSEEPRTVRPGTYRDTTVEV